jgi:multidrug efflux pump subunit AcrA (membrane-fusion protein)
MNKSNKYILIAVVVVVALLVLWIMFRPSTVTVEAAKVTRGDMLVTIDAEGRTRFKDKFTVTAPVSGQMKRIDLHEGDLIPRGYIITEVDPNPPTLPRPPAELDGSISPWSAKVYSPITGRVLQVIEKNERVVAAGTPIIEIGNPGPVEIVIDILSSQATQVRPGTDVLIENENGAPPIKARVRVVEPQAITKVSALGVEERRVNIIADVMSKDARYGDNFRVDTHIIVWQGKNILSVPSSALFRNGEVWNVFVVQLGMAHRREVQIGRQSSTQTEIVGGIDEGETVILHPPNELTENSFVNIQ